MNRVISFFRILHSDPNYILDKIVRKFNWLFSDKQYLSIVYRLAFHKKINWDNPQTFNEKLNWLKVHDRRPIYTTMVDKYSAKEYVRQIIGDKYIIETYGVWDRGEDINWDKLPNQFVLKTTHGAGNNGVVICRDKSLFNKEWAIRKLNASLDTDIFSRSRAWPYKNIKRRIIAERYLQDKNGELRDYKFFSFDGQVKAMFVATDRNSGDVKFDFFDTDFSHLDIVQVHSMSGKVIEKPECFEEMKLIASKLSKGFPHIRVDLYEVDGNVYFGELTLYHHSGIVPFHPEKWDFTFGSWLTLPSNEE